MKTETILYFDDLLLEFTEVVGWLFIFVFWVLSAPLGLGFISPPRRLDKFEGTVNE